jgi:DNA-3-methyladenine glycosylase
MKDLQEDEAACLLPQSFYARDAVLVARDLLGKIIRRGPVLARITETEAYCWPQDSANHSYRGKTARNSAMWGPPGHAYVYICYGLHNMLNFVTNHEGEAAAVLIRSCEPVAGLAIIKARRGNLIEGPSLLAGPGRVGQALAIDISFCHHPLFIFGGLEVLDAPPVVKVLEGSRIGIDYASQPDRQAPWRFADGNSLFVTKLSLLAERTMNQ